MDPKIRWGVPQTRATLMIPGPTELPWPVIQAMSQPPIIQYDQHFDVKILEPVTLGLRKVFQTDTGEVIAMPGSGRTALESAAVSVIEPGDRVVVVIAGVFGVLMREIMARVGAAHRPRRAGEGDRARAAEGGVPGPQRDLHGDDLPRRRRGAAGQEKRRALHAGHR